MAIHTKRTRERLVVGSCENIVGSCGAGEDLLGREDAQPMFDHAGPYVEACVRQPNRSNSRQRAPAAGGILADRAANVNLTGALARPPKPIGR
jgi:hypothetical protein